MLPSLQPSNPSALSACSFYEKWVVKNNEEERGGGRKNLLFFTRPFFSMTCSITSMFEGSKKFKEACTLNLVTLLPPSHPPFPLHHSLLFTPSMRTMNGVNSPQQRFFLKLVGTFNNVVSLDARSTNLTVTRINRPTRFLTQVF